MNYNSMPNSFKKETMNKNIGLSTEVRLNPALFKINCRENILKRMPTTH